MTTSVSSVRTSGVKWISSEVSSRWAHAGQDDLAITPGSAPLGDRVKLVDGETGQRVSQGLRLSEDVVDVGIGVQVDDGHEVYRWIQTRAAPISPASASR